MNWTPESRRLGLLCAWMIALLSVLYLFTGFGWMVISAPAKVDPWTPLDPFRAILEFIILLVNMAMLGLMVAVYHFSSREHRSFTLMALLLMVLAAGTTAGVHFVELTVGRQIDVRHDPALSKIFFTKWPSALFALDLLAWDGFLGLSLLFAAPAFSGDRLQRLVRWSLIVTGLLCLGGLIGPLSGDLMLQVIGIAGYAFAFPITCALLGILFKRTAPAVPEAGVAQEQTT